MEGRRGLWGALLGMGEVWGCMWGGKAGLLREEEA